MKQHSEPHISITLEELQPIVRRALNRTAAEIVNWQSNALYGASSNSKIVRFAGSARDRDTILPWSLILKIVRPDDQSDDPTSLRYWKREALAYQSGLLDNLPGKIRAPHCYEIVEQPDRAVWLWLEEVADDTKGKWSLEQYGNVARQVGEFNGIFFENEPAFSHPWMTKKQLRSWIGTNAPILPPEILAHPLVSRFFSADIYKWMQGIWSEHTAWLDIIECQPKTLSHLDVFRRNAFMRHTPEGDSQTVLIDWAFVGGAALGEEIAPLVIGSINFMDFDSTQIRELDRVVFEAYLEGLRSAGWHGDPRLIRFAHAVGSTLKFSIGIFGVAYMVADENRHPILEQMFGHTVETLVGVWGNTLHFLTELAEEARELASHL